MRLLDIVEVSEEINSLSEEAKEVLLSLAADGSVDVDTDNLYLIEVKEVLKSMADICSIDLEVDSEVYQLIKLIDQVMDGTLDYDDVEDEDDY
jgi:fructose-1-phosphate kinase PfkB-like protein